MKLFKRIIAAIAYPFILYIEMCRQSKIENENGIWDKYHERRNRKRGE